MLDEGLDSLMTELDKIQRSVLSTLFKEHVKVWQNSELILKTIWNSVLHFSLPDVHVFLANSDENNMCVH